MLLSLQGQCRKKGYSLLSCHASFTVLSADDNHLTWWPLQTSPSYIQALILPSIIHCCAWLIMTTRTTWDLVCWFAVKRQSCERSWPPACGLSISILVQLCLPSILPSSILHHSSFLFFSKHYPWGMGEMERGSVARKGRKRERES